MLKEIQDVARSVESRWRRKRYDGRAFPAIATAVLRERGLHVTLSPDALLRWISSARRLPRQLSMHSTFGHPPVTLCWRKRFLIDAYLWHMPEATIHSHSFSGAFTLLQGRSLQVRHAFRVRRRYGADLMVGDLTTRDATILRCGDVRPIEPGTDLIHRVIHLSHPTISVAVRTRGDRNGPPIYNFTEPHMAARSVEYLPDTGRKKMRVIEFLARVGHPRMEHHVEEMVRPADHLHTFWFLKQAFTLTRDLAMIKRVMRGLRRRAWFEPFLKSLAVSGAVKVRWEALTDEGERLFAALGATVRDPALARRLITEFAPERPPADSIVRWIRGLSSKHAIDLTLNPTAERVLQGLLMQETDAQVCDRLQREFDVSDPRALRSDVQRSRRHLKAIPLLEPFLARSR